MGPSSSNSVQTMDDETDGNPSGGRNIERRNVTNPIGRSNPSRRPPHVISTATNLRRGPSPILGGFHPRESSFRGTGPSGTGTAVNQEGGNAAVENANQSQSQSNQPTAVNVLAAGISRAANRGSNVINTSGFPPTAVNVNTSAIAGISRAIVATNLGSNVSGFRVSRNVNTTAIASRAANAGSNEQQQQAMDIENGHQGYPSEILPTNENGPISTEENRRPTNVEEAPPVPVPLSEAINTSHEGTQSLLY